jgi:hypothetical protein
MMKRAIPLGVLAILLLRPAMAKDTRFWNLTSSTVKSLELAPAGASAFGPNQTTNDGRVCMAKGVQIEAGKVFTIEDKELVGCSR